MESQQVKSLKGKVLATQLQKAKETLQIEIEQNKQKSLELRKTFDLLKSKNALRSLQLKKRVEETSAYLSESRFTWKSESLNLKNSIEIFQVNQLKKRLAKEKVFEELLRLMSSIDLPDDVEKENQFKNNCYQALDSSCNWSESTLNQTLMKTVDSIKEKLRNYTSLSEGNTLTAVEEKIEMSVDTNMDFSDETSEEPRRPESGGRVKSPCVSEDNLKIGKDETGEDKNDLGGSPKLSDRASYEKSYLNIKEKISQSPLKLEWLPFDDNSSLKDSLKNDSISQLKSVSSRVSSHRNHLKYLITEGPSLSARQSSSENIENSSKQAEEDDTIIGLICDPSQIMTTLAMPTQGDGLNSSQKGSAYLISDSEVLEKTQEIEVKRKTWKSWLCPCIFKTF